MINVFKIFSEFILEINTLLILKLDVSEFILDIKIALFSKNRLTRLLREVASSLTPTVENLLT